MRTRIKEIAISVSFLIVIVGLLVFSLLWKDKEISESERRRLTKAPEVTVEGICSGSYMKKFSNYVVEQFPLRDTFRMLKANMHYNVYQQKDSNGLYFEENMIAKLEYPLDEESTKYFAERICRVYNDYLMGNDSVYYAIVPDKNYFLAGENGYPSFDYQKQLTLVQENLPKTMQYIDLFDTLSLEDYYRTDAHWRCEKLQETVRRVAETMEFESRMSYEYRVQTLKDDFYGVYSGQVALNFEPESLFYIENDAILNAQVIDKDKNITGGVYYDNYREELDDYAYFFNGASSLVVIDNPLATQEKELIMFRDSFGSAIAPWLIEAYSSITLIDIRYITPEALEQFVSFDGKDVLFLYSTAVINNSETFK